MRCDRLAATAAANFSGGGVVFNLHQADYIGVEIQNSVNDLGALAVEFLGIIGAATIHCGAAHAAGAASEGIEVVEDVEAGDAHLPTDGGRRGAARVGGGDEVNRAHRLEVVLVVVLIQHTGQAGEGVAGAQGVGRAQINRNA